MASIQVRKETGNLLLDFYFRGIRCREQTSLPDVPENRVHLQKIATRIDKAIERGTFEYAEFFPRSRNAARFASENHVKVPGDSVLVTTNLVGEKQAASAIEHTLFEDFANIWFSEKEVEWRRSHRALVRSDLDRLLIPRFGRESVCEITRAMVLEYRAELMKTNAKKKETTLSTRRVNRILTPLRQILTEAADRYGFRSPFERITQLKVKRVDVHPFTLSEIERIVEHVRPEYRNYYLVRFFSGMRTGEIDGLKWDYVDFERRLILVRETLVLGEEGEAKTEGSIRDIQMCQLVFDALQAQRDVTFGRSRFVFVGPKGGMLHHRNVTQRIWYPLLRKLGIKARRPSQTRHTAATLWLAAGESPQWIAAQLGHTTTELLFRIYARFVPNLTRQDGSAFERLLAEKLVVTKSLIRTGA